MKIQIENLKAQMRGVELNIHQRADALIEFNKLIEYTENLESKVENLGLFSVRLSLPNDEQIERKAEFRQKPRNPKNTSEEEFIYGFMQGADWIIGMIDSNEA